MITKSRLPRMTAWVVPFAVGLLLAGDVRAQSTNRPWSSGVSQEQQMRAKVLYAAGNRFLANSQFAEAATAYRGALQHWDHPGIHYTLALALISLDRPIEASEAIVEALRYGPDALHPDEYRRALDYLRLLREQNAEVEIVCAEPGAAVFLDSKPLFMGPDRVTTLVLPGKHEVVASKAKYITSSETFTMTAGEHLRIEFHLIAKPRRRTSPRAVPAAVQVPRSTEHQGTRARNYGATTALVDAAVVGLTLIPALDDGSYGWLAVGYVFAGQATHAFHGNSGTGLLSSLNRVVIPLMFAGIGSSLYECNEENPGCQGELRWGIGGAFVGVAAALSLDWFVLSRDRVAVTSESNVVFWPVIAPADGGWMVGVAKQFW
jgi:hypothetical protein